MSRRRKHDEDEIQVYGHEDCGSEVAGEAVRSIGKIDDNGHVTVVYSCECTPGSHIVDVFEFVPSAVVEITGGVVPLPWSNPLPVTYLDHDSAPVLYEWDAWLEGVHTVDDLTPLI